MSEFGFTSVPELVPARMVNEFSYCRRLFFIEWVQSRFVDNAYTVDGRWQHRAVDVEAGAAPLPDEGEIKVARSVLLSSERLGLIGKADLLEGSGDVVTPIEVKRGSAPDVPSGAYEPERVQLCVIGLLLRDAGYQTTGGVFYFAGSRQRVSIPFDDELVSRTLELVAELRVVASTGVPPPPLVDSRKCDGCSLAGICLPDETNALAARSDSPPRRLLPSDPSPRPLYVTEQGAFVGRSKGRVEVKHKGELLLSIRLIDVSQLCIYGNAQISSQLIRELLAREIPICWFSYGGWFSGIAEGLPSKHVELRRHQTAVAHRGGLAIARRIVEGKIRNSRTLLMRNSRERPVAAIASMKALAEKAAVSRSSESLLGHEGAAARFYFESFPLMLREDRRLPGTGFNFEHRNRRPPRDAVNCLLSFVYGILVKDCTSTLFAVGFDPYLGFYHRPRFGRPALALDLAEEFRPLLGDSVVLNLINNGEVSSTDFVVRAGGVALTASGRKAVMRGYERRLDTRVRHPIFGYKISYRRVIEVQARLLGAHLLGEIPDYSAFVTR